MRCVKLLIFAASIFILLASSAIAKSPWFVSGAIDVNAEQYLISDNQQFSSLYSLGIGREVVPNLRLSLQAIYAADEKYPGEGNSWGIGLRVQRDLRYLWRKTRFFVGGNMMLMNSNITPSIIITSNQVSHSNNQSGVIGDGTLDPTLYQQNHKNLQFGLDLGLDMPVSEFMNFQISSGVSHESYDAVYKSRDDYYIMVEGGDISIDANEVEDEAVKYKDRFYWNVRVGLTYNF